MGCRVVEHYRGVTLTFTRKPAWPLWGGVCVSAALLGLAAAMFATLWLAGRGQGTSGLQPGTVGQVLSFT
ncbi:hypothetical protein ACFL1S_08075, partial [Pseudomonadota bacterium]